MSSLYEDDPDNNIAETELYQIYSLAKHTIHTLPAEHLYIIRNTAFNDANIHIIIFNLNKLGFHHIHPHSPIDHILPIYQNILSQHQQYDLAATQAIHTLDQYLELNRLSSTRINLYILQAQSTFQEHQHEDQHDTRGLQHEIEIANDFIFQLSELYVDTLMRRRAFIQYIHDVSVIDSGVAS